MKQLLLVTFYDKNRNNLAYRLYENIDHFVADHAERRKMDYETWESIYLPETVARRAYEDGTEILKKGA